MARYARWAVRFFLDTEFAENGETIKLMSLALVREDGQSCHYRLADGWTPDDCNDWVRANVLPHLPSEFSELCQPRAVVREAIREWLLCDGPPEIWGYFSDYDWVVLCQLFGTMMDLPEGFPMFCLDLKQEMHRLGVKRDQLPAQEGTAHDALADARWIREAFFALQAMNPERGL